MFQKVAEAAGIEIFVLHVMLKKNDFATDFVETRTHSLENRHVHYYPMSFGFRV